MSREGLGRVDVGQHDEAIRTYRLSKVVTMNDRVEQSRAQTTRAVIDRADAITEAREAGHTLAVIGKALGVNTQRVSEMQRQGARAQKLNGSS